MGWPKQIGGKLSALVGRLLVVTGGLSAFAPCAIAQSDDQPKGQFESYEVRVIRPKYFTKARRAEVGAQMSVIMNQTFIYTYLMTGVLNYHFTESLGLEVDGSYGLSLDKEDKGILKKPPTSINTTILRTQYQMLGGLVWTPLYGKYQLASGRLIYFDTFLIGGGGLTGIDYQYDHCIKSPSGRTADPPAPQTKSYVGGMFGIGQRFFINKSLSLRFEVRDNFFSVDSRDGSCDPEYADSEMTTTNNITMQFGASKFL